jgi:hypothetical protein
VDLHNGEVDPRYQKGLWFYLFGIDPHKPSIRRYDTLHALVPRLPRHGHHRDRHSHVAQQWHQSLLAGRHARAPIVKESFNADQRIARPSLQVRL